MGKRYKMLNGEKMPEFRARCQRLEEERRAPPPPPKPKRVRKSRAKPKPTPIADKVDGFDRDNLGLSPD